MQGLAINFAKQRRAVSWVGVLLCLAGVAAAAAVWLDYRDARAAFDRAELRQTRMQRVQRTDVMASRRVLPSSAAGADAPVAQRAMTQLNLPWSRLLEEIETHADRSIALLGIEGQGLARSVRITGEARTMADVVAYIQQLRQSPLINAATLSGHEEKINGAVRLVRFTLDVAWGGQP